MQVKQFRADRHLLMLILIVALVFHVAALGVFGIRHVAASAPISARPRVRWTPSESDSSIIAAPVGNVTSQTMAELLDPSLSTLPSPRGFSRKMWTRAVPVSRQTLDFSATPAFLELTATNSFASLLRETPLEDVVLASLKKIPGELEEPIGESIEAAIVVNQTVVRVEGTVVWNVIRSPQWPTISSAKPLVPTRVRAGVGADGEVRFTALERSCGDEGADAQALELLRQVRFTPQAVGEPTALKWVMISVIWAMQPLPPAPATNGKTPTP